MSDLVAALGLVLVLEGILYAGFPQAARNLMRQSLALPENVLRGAGLVALALGLTVVWLVRG